MAMKLILTLSKKHKLQMPNIKNCMENGVNYILWMKLSFTFCSQSAGITIGSTCTLCGKKQETHTEFCVEIYWKATIWIYRVEKGR